MVEIKRYKIFNTVSKFMDVITQRSERLLRYNKMYVFLKEEFKYFFLKQFTSHQSVIGRIGPGRITAAARDVKLLTCPQ